MLSSAIIFRLRLILASLENYCMNLYYYTLYYYEILFYIIL